MKCDSKKLDLSNLGLTKIPHIQYATWFQEIDLSGNLLKTATFPEYFLNCRQLKLDQNPIDGMIKLPRLIENCSVKDCGIVDKSSIMNLNQCSHLKDFM